MHQRLLPAAFVVLVAACGGKKAATVPDPNTGASTPAPPPPPPPPASSGNTTPTRNDGAAEAERGRLLSVLMTPIHFEYDKDDVRGGVDQAALDAKAAILLANPSVRLKISGHADERGSDEYNIVLGNRRAASAKRYLESKGVDGSRLETISYGEERPVDNGGTEEAWAKNRRDEFEVTSGADRLVAPR